MTFSQSISIWGGIFDSVATTANTTTYAFIAGTTSSNTTESKMDVPIRSAGTLSNFYMRISANSCSGTTTYTLRDSTTPGDVNENISVPTATTGEFEDISNQDTITSGHQYCVHIVPAGGSTGTNTMTILKLSFLPSTSTDTVTRFVTSWASATLVTASQSYYSAISGLGSSLSLTESTCACRQRKTGKYRYLACQVSANNRTTATTATLRKDTGSGPANGNQTVSITSATTGVFEDTNASTHDDSVSAGNDVDIKVATGSDTGHSLTLENTAVSFVSDASAGILQLTSGHSVGSSQSAALTRFIGITGRVQGNEATEDNVKLKLGHARTYSELTAHVITNTSTTNGTMNFRKNSANGNMTFSVPNNTTGVFSDSSNTDIAGNNDYIDYAYTSGATNATIIGQISCWGIQFVDLAASASLTLSSSITRGGTFFRNLTASLTFSDSNSRLLHAFRVIQETLSLSAVVLNAAKFRLPLFRKKRGWL